MIKVLENLQKTIISNAIEELKLAQRKLKSGKINDNGLNFSRGQLAIAYLCSGEKKVNWGR